MTRRIPIAIALLATAALVLAACGSDSSSTATSSESSGSPATSAYGGGSSGGDSTTDSTGASSAGGATVKIEADPNGDLAFTKATIDAPAGSDTIEFDNPSSTGHNVYLEDGGGSVVAETDTISDGKTSAPADLKPGTYTFYCAIPGHREAGMEGTLTVK